MNSDPDLFVFQLSQELHAQVRQVKSFSKVLVNSLEEPTTKQLEFAGFLDGAADTLESKLNALLAYSRIKLNHQFLIESNFSEILQDSFAVFKTRHTGFTYEIDYACDDDRIKIDMNLFELVIFEILGNALKFSDQEQMHMFIRLEQDGECLVCRWIDNGAGIPGYLKEKVFQIFNKGERLLDTSSPGMGLSKVQKILALHDGHISMEVDIREGVEHQIGQSHCYPVLRLPLAQHSIISPLNSENPDDILKRIGHKIGMLK